MLELDALLHIALPEALAVLQKAEIEKWWSA
jgi:hypothetical protein